MAHSLEIRVPLVDVVMAGQVGRQRATGDRYGKRDLAACAGPPLPAEVLARPKTGFTVPVRDWMMQAGHAEPRQRGQRAWQEAVLRHQSGCIDRNFA